MKAKNSWLTKDILGFGLTSFFNDFAHEMTNAILPSFVESLVGVRFAPQALGIITGISNAASSLIRLWSGLIADKIYKYKPIIIIGYALTPIFVSLISIAKNIWQVIIFRMIAWLGRGIREPLRDKWMSSILEPSNYGKGFGFTRALDTLGAIVGPLVAFFFIKYLSLNSIFLLALIPGIFSVLSLIFLTSEQNDKSVLNNKNNFFDQIKKLPSFFLFFVFILFIFNLAYFDKIFLILKAQKMLLAQEASSMTSTGYAILLYAIFNVIRASAEYSIGYLSDLLNRKKLLAFLGFGVFCLMSLCLTFYISNLFFWLLIFILAGISIATITVVTRILVADLLPLDIRGTGYGLLQTTEGIGQLISGIIFGGLWTYFSGVTALMYSAILAFIAMLLLISYKH